MGEGWYRGGMIQGSPLFWEERERGRGQEVERRLDERKEQHTWDVK